ncbi:MAG TPA: dihydrodipicolinate synthase family protein, partial [Planctomycetota bacterium]|nr:dihydrodipicolinate synthase family protein [Planctomycetota bacterium]
MTPALPGGLWVAVATPFASGDAVDLPAFRRLVRRLVECGVDALVVLGSTGQAATLDDDERDALVTAALSEARGRAV